MDGLWLQRLVFDEMTAGIFTEDGQQVSLGGRAVRQHMVLTWNHCMGMSSSALKELPNSFEVNWRNLKLLKQRDALRSALECIRDHDPNTCPGITASDCLDSVRETARHALALCEEEST